jgi:hypothetical protein
MRRAAATRAAAVKCRAAVERRPAVDGGFSHVPRGGTAGVSGEQVEDKAFYDAASIAAMRIGCLPGNARNAVAMAAIAANTQADRKT